MTDYLTYELLSQDGSTVHVYRNHLIPYYPKEPPLYPHLHSGFMRFSDSTQLKVPKPIKHANSDSSPFNFDESLSDKNPPQKPITPSTASNYNFQTTSLNDHSPIKQFDNSPFKKIIKTLQTDMPIDISRHPSQDHSNLLLPPIDRTRYILRHQPQMDYRLFISPSKLKKNHSLYWLNEE